MTPCKIIVDGQPSTTYPNPSAAMRAAKIALQIGAKNVQVVTAESGEVRASLGEDHDALYTEGQLAYAIGRPNDGNGLSGAARLSWQDGWEDAAASGAQ